MGASAYDPALRLESDERRFSGCSEPVGAGPELSSTFVIVATFMAGARVDAKVFVATISSMARPEKPPEERKENVLRIRLTDVERTELDKAADGKTSSWARAVLLRAARRISR